MILLVRHSISVGGPADPGLSSDGRTLATRAAAALADWEPVRVFTSPLRRARETAEVIAAGLHCVVEVDDRLRERNNWGDISGETRDAFVARWEQCNLDRDLVPPYGRSARQAGAALASFVDEKAREGGTAVGVTHGGIIVDFLLDWMPAEALARYKPDFREMCNCALTEIAVRADGYDLLRFADACLVSEP